MWRPPFPVCLAGCVLLFLSGPGFAHGPIPTAPEPPASVERCAGITPLYTLPASEEWPERARWQGVRWFPDVPVAFEPSGDPCRGPVPIYRIPGLEGTVEAADSHLVARRIAPQLRAFTRTTGFEACARMCRQPSGRVIAQAVTVRAHVVCVAPPTTCPAGSTPLAETIHSHPMAKAVQGNAVDAVGWEEPVEGQWIWLSAPNRFSPQDRRQAPVWLVGSEPWQLLYLDHPEGQEVERP